MEALRERVEQNRAEISKWSRARRAEDLQMKLKEKEALGKRRKDNYKQFQDISHRVAVLRHKMKALSAQLPQKLASLRSQHESTQGQQLLQL
jgi:hypothetical protein